MNKEQIARRMRDHMTGSDKDPVRLRIERDTVFVGVLKLWPAPDEAFVRGLIRLLLGHEADPAGLEYGLALLRRGSRLQTVRLLATCEEAQVRRLDASWLPDLERLHPDGWRGWRILRRAARGVFGLPGRMGATFLRRLWQWSGNPLRDPVAELVAHARRAEKAAKGSRASQKDTHESPEERRWREVYSRLGELQRTCADLVAAIETGGAAAWLTRKQGGACPVCGGAMGGDGAAS
jgi:hypothetical protein